MSEQTNSILDEINAEVAQLSDEEIAKAAASILQGRERAKSRMTPDRKENMRQQEKKRRERQKAILAMAKQKGLVDASGQLTV